MHARLMPSVLRAGAACAGAARPLCAASGHCAPPAPRTQTCDGIPVIDISPFLAAAGSAAAANRARTAVELAHACEHVGFFYVINHGVDDALLGGVQCMAREFFALELPHKLRSSMQKAGASVGRGFQQLGLNVTQGRRDWHEAVDMFRELGPEQLADPALRRAVAERPELADVLAGRNVWPAEFDRALTMQYVASMRRLGAAVMRAMAVSLGLPDDVFERSSLTDDSFWILRFIHYPACGSMPAVEGEGGAPGLGCGAHTDYGCLTIVNQDDTTDSLEVLAKDGAWMKANPQAGALCLNIGDMVEHWSRGRYKSTLHRVLRPPANRSRVSVPFFFEPNALARITPLLPASPQEGSKSAAIYDGEVVYIHHLYSKVSTDFGAADPG